MPYLCIHLITHVLVDKECGRSRVSERSDTAEKCKHAKLRVYGTTEQQPTRPMCVFAKSILQKVF